MSEKPRRKRLILSASQSDNALDCKRKWWFQKVARLPEPVRRPDPRTIGEVLHEVGERYLGSDDTQDVDLYPALRDTGGGRMLPWTSVVSAFGADKGVVRSIEPAEAAMIQKLIAAAIAGGVLIKADGGRIESRFDIPMAPAEEHGEVEDPSGAITFMGFRDYVSARDTVEDHKTGKRNRSPWRKTAKALRKNTQMLCYAYSLIWEARQRGEIPPPTITVIHNFFSKDPDDLGVKRTVSAPIPRQEIEDWWSSTIVPLAHELRKVRRLKEWHQVEGPSVEGACSKYGGCPYMRICGGVFSVEKYRKRVERGNSLPQAMCQTPSVVSASEQPTQKRNTSMSAAQRLAAKAAKRKALSGGKAAAPAPAAPKPAPKAAAPAPAAPKPAKAVRPSFEGDTPPWAIETCKACEGAGFNSKGRACKMCDLKSAKAGGLTSKAFAIDGPDDGFIAWQGGDDDEICGAVELIPGEVKTVVADPPAPAPAPELEPEPEQTPAEAAAVDALLNPEKPKAKPKAKPKPRKRSKPKPAAEPKPKPDAEPEPQSAAEAQQPAGEPGFTLLIDCHPASGGGVTHVADLLHRLGTDMAKAAGKESFYQLDAFKRRDALCQAAPDLVSDLTGFLLASSGCSPDEKAFLAAIRPLASMVIAG